MIRRLLKASEKVLSDRLPPAAFFATQDAIRPLLDRRLARAGRQVRAVGNVFEVRWADGTAFSFPHPRRYCRYMFPEGLEHVLQGMLDKYQDGEVQIAPGDVVFEIGANVGEFTVAAARKGARVFSAEPDPNAWACLSRNVAYEADILTFPFAVGAENGSADFYVSSAAADSSLLEGAGQRVEVEVVTLPTWMERCRVEAIDFLKLEAEGYEPEILEGARSALGSIRKLAVDCGPERYGRPTFDECEAILKDRFRLWRKGWMLFGVKLP